MFRRLIKFPKAASFCVIGRRFLTDSGDDSKYESHKNWDPSIRGATGGDDRLTAKVLNSGDVSAGDPTGVYEDKPLKQGASGYEKDAAGKTKITTGKDGKRKWTPKDWAWEPEVDDAPGTPIMGGTAPDNKPGQYDQPPEENYLEKDSRWKPARDPNEVKPGQRGREDNIKQPEFRTSFGNFESRPAHAGIPGIVSKDKLKRDRPQHTVSDKDIRAHSPAIDHHPYYDYINRSGKKDGYDTYNTPTQWNFHSAIFSMYRSSLQGLALVKQYYYLNLPLDQMKDRVKAKFYQNRYVKDPDAIRNLLLLGWNEYSEIITFRKQRGSLLKFFNDSDVLFKLAEMYTEEENQLMEERKMWNGEEQKREGPYDGFWSLAGKVNFEEFQKLAGRVPMAWSSSKNYFETWRCDGTNPWEKNLDYEGWYLKNMDPDKAAGRKEIQNWVSAGYQQPKHYASKNRRTYRRLVKDVETVMNSTTHELYAASREEMFQYYIRDRCPETNRLHAEKLLARQDDEIFTTKYDVMDKLVKQVMREMPNPRLWKTDAFYFRLRYLMGPQWELNWAKAPIGMEQEKLYNEWVSLDYNYAILNSPEFEAIRANKQQNPMAKSWADFYSEFDPDKPETRCLPWYHKDFDYDRRHFWDERCMRFKKWVASGDIDFKHGFFESQVFEWEQFVNRPEIVRNTTNQHRKYSAPRMVQLYRSLIRRMDVALVNQMAEAIGIKKLEKLGEAEVQKLVKAHNWEKFKFKVPAVIYPDGEAQPAMRLDGRPQVEATQ